VIRRKEEEAASRPLRRACHHRTSKPQSRPIAILTSRAQLARRAAAISWFLLNSLPSLPTPGHHPRTPPTVTSAYRTFKPVQTRPITLRDREWHTRAAATAYQRAPIASQPLLHLLPPTIRPAFPLPKWVRIGFGPWALSFVFNKPTASVLIKQHPPATGAAVSSPSPAACPVAAAASLGVRQQGYPL